MCATKQQSLSQSTKPKAQTLLFCSTHLFINKTKRYKLVVFVSVYIARLFLYLTRCPVPITCSTKQDKEQNLTFLKYIKKHDW
jgi:hypothetical protein